MEWPSFETRTFETNSVEEWYARKIEEVIDAIQHSAYSSVKFSTKPLHVQYYTRILGQDWLISATSRLGKGEESKVSTRRENGLLFTNGMDTHLRKTAAKNGSGIIEQEKPEAFEL